MIMNRRGFVLIVVLVFLVVVAIASVDLYNAAYLAGKMQGIDEVGRIRGYYAASAGISYASAILAGSSLPTAPISVKTAYPALYNDLGLAGSEDVAIIITAREDGEYDVTSTYTFSAGQIRIAAIVPKPVVGLPKTGQTTLYHQYDDGDYEMGNPVNPRFVLGAGAGAGTVTDNATGLMWEQKTNDGGIHDKDNTYTWVNTFDKFLNGVIGVNGVTVDGLNKINDSIGFAGHNDWRIPNAMELASIVRYSGSAPVIDSKFKTSPYYTCPGIYWTSSTHISDTSLAVIVYFYFNLAYVCDAHKTDMHYVRAVRGGTGGLH